jgi:hypothetical protein
MTALNASRSRSRTCSAPPSRACAPRRDDGGSRILDELRAALRVDRVAESVGRRRGDARQDQPRRVRDGLVEQTSPTAVRNPWRAAATTGRWCRAARRAARRRRSRRGSRWAPPAPTPAARSASRPPSAASSASSRPTGAARAGASSPSPRRSTRPGRSRARARRGDHAAARWRVTIRRTRPRCRAPVPDYEAALTGAVKGLRFGIPRSTGSTACRRRSRSSGSRASPG